MRVARPVVLNAEQKEALEQCARARSLSVRMVERARIVLLAATGKQDKNVAAALNITAHKAARWRNRFLDLGMAGLEKDAPRAGRTPSIPAATLFAALNTFDGKIISLCQQRHRHQEWLLFLRLVDDATPHHKQLHLIVDNYATHKHPAVQRWLKRHPRFHFHFTPTSASWLNMVERFFRDLTVNRLRRGVFRDVMELVTAIDSYVDHHNENPKPFIWTASAKDILEKVKRARKTLLNVQSE